MLLLIAAEEVAEASNPILPAWNEMFWGAVSFALLYALVLLVLLPPVQRVREEREATLRADRDAAEAAKAKAASAAMEVNDQLAGVRAEAAELIEEARAEAEAERQRLIARAQREVAAETEISEQRIAVAREEAMAALAPQVTDLAIDAASRVTGRTVDPAAARPVIERVMSS